jgi:hypothetical protein
MLQFGQGGSMSSGNRAARSMPPAWSPVGRSRPLPRVGRGPAVDADLDVLDRVMGRAAVDPAFAGALLARPGETLDLEEMDLRLKRALGRIRAATLGEFARLALDAQQVVEGGR